MSEISGQDYDYLFKVLLLGDSGAGKSSLILRYTDETFNGSLVSSIGVDFKMKKKVVNDKTIKIQIWDTAGHERFRSITTSYYRGANAIIIVYDITDKSSFEHISDWLKQINKYAQGNVLKFLVGNKADLNSKREVSIEEAQSFAKEFNLPYVETSAKQGKNIVELFDLSIKTYLDANNFVRDNNIKIEAQGDEKEGCCK